MMERRTNHNGTEYIPKDSHAGGKHRLQYSKNTKMENQATQKTTRRKQKQQSRKYTEEVFLVQIKPLRNTGFAMAVLATRHDA